MMSAPPPRRGPVAQLGKMVREIRAMIATTAYTGPCGHECTGDAKSWSCPTCGSSGSSS